MNPRGEIGQAVSGDMESGAFIAYLLVLVIAIGYVNTERKISHLRGVRAAAIVGVVGAVGYAFPAVLAVLAAIVAIAFAYGMLTS